MAVNAQIDLGFTFSFPRTMASAVVKEKGSVGIQISTYLGEFKDTSYRVSIGWMGLNGRYFEIMSNQSYAESDVSYAGFDVHRILKSGHIGIIAGIELQHDYRKQMSAPDNAHINGNFVASEKMLNIAPSIGLLFKLYHGNKPLYMEMRYLHPFVVKKFGHNGLDPPQHEMRLYLYVTM